MDGHGYYHINAFILSEVNKFVGGGGAGECNNYLARNACYIMKVHYGNFRVT